MSRYAVNAVMREVNMSPDSLDRYRTDSVAFVRDWLAAGGPGLDETEERALAARDYLTLYRLGAHPYLLWSFTEAVLVPEISRPDLVTAFKAGTAEIGYPDCRTVATPELPESWIHYKIEDLRPGGGPR